MSRPSMLMNRPIKMNLILVFRALVGWYRGEGMGNTVVARGHLDMLSPVVLQRHRGMAGC